MKNIFKNNNKQLFLENNFENILNQKLLRKKKRTISALLDEDIFALLDAGQRERYIHQIINVCLRN